MVSFSTTNDYGISADCVHLEDALAAHWESFDQLTVEVNAFSPKNSPVIAEFRAASVENLKKLNPNAANKDLVVLI